LVWANYDLSASTLAGSQSEYVSANYVSALITDIIGIESEPYYSFLRAAFNEIPVITAYGYSDKDGVFYSRENAAGATDLNKILNEYQLLQYYYLKDKYTN
jgi:hypothetical protein